jgi:drug/metabolite transporter (DMT)-like permease
LNQNISANPKHSVGRGYAIAIFGVAVWSATATFIAYLTSRYPFPPFLLAAWRDAIAGVTVWLVLRAFRPNLLRLPRSQWGFVLGYGLLLSGFNALWTVSVVMNGAAVSTVMVYSSAAFTVLIAWRMFGEGMSLAKAGAALLGIAGCVLVSGANDPGTWQSNTLGVITGLVSGLAFTAYSLMGKITARRGISSWTALTYTFMLAALLLVGYNFLLPSLGGVTLGSPSLLPALDMRGWVALILLGLGPTIGGYGLYNYSLTILPASVVNLLATMEPAMTAVQSYLLLGERFTSSQGIGGLLILGGVVIIRLMENRVSSEPANASIQP